MAIKAYFPKLKSKKYIKNLNSQIKEYSPLGKKNKLLSQKIKSYRIQLSKKLNIIHNVDYDIQYWGFLIDSFLSDFDGESFHKLILFNQLKKF